MRRRYPADAGNKILDQLGLTTSVAGTGAELFLRADVASNPGLLCTGVVQYDGPNRCYYISDTDNSVVNEMAALFDDTVTFEAAGSTRKTTATFSAYATSLVSGLSNAISALELKKDSQSDLVTTLYSKSQEVSGVNLDEELANLITFQRTYSACSKAFQTASELLEILDNMV